MSTLKSINVIHPSGTTNNIVNDASGNVTIGAALTAGTVTSPSATALTIQSAGTTAMTVDTSQNVGIGTSSPSASGGTVNFVVNSTGTTIIKSQTSSTTTGTARYDYATGTANSYVTSSLKDNSGVPYYQLAGGSAVLTSYTDITTQVFRSTGGGTEYMRIDSGGNVGIGTSSTSTYKLNVNGVANFALGSGVYANNADMRLETATGYGWRMGTASTGSTLGYFYIQGSTDNFVSSFINSLYIDSSGNVGVGTSSPSGRLSFGTSAGFKGIQLYDDGSGASGFGITSNTLNVYSGGSTIAFGTGQTSAGTTLTSGSMYLVSGSLGIGTASPDASAILDAQSTTKGVRFPNMTTTQKNAISSPAAGLVVFDTTLAKLCVYSGSAWQTITSI